MKIRILHFQEKEHLSLISQVTEILHKAYKPLADRGYRYSASHQTPEKTLERMKRGEAYLAFCDKQLVGTITLYGHNMNSPCEYYRRKGVDHFGQFAVDLGFQGHGIGNSLLRFIEERAKQFGGEELALDTAEGAVELIGMYKRRGFRIVSTTKWSSTNYQSVVMAKEIKS